MEGINCKLIIVGKSSEGLIQKLDSHKVSFTFKSGLTNDELIQEYESCDLLSFVSTYEGFGLPIIEAQAIGRPVITSNLSSMPEVAGKSALLVDPYSVKEIKVGIQKIISDQKLRENLIQQGLKNVERFHPNKVAEDYLKIYSRISV